MSNGHNLVSDYDYYDNSDIMVGLAQSNQDKVGQLLRDLLESADFHVVWLVKTETF